METNQTLTAIQTAVQLSKSIIACKMLLERLRRSKSYMNSISKVMFHEAGSALDTAIADVSYTIEVTEKRIYTLIKPFLSNHDYNYPNKYSFSAKELVEGFATIERVLTRGAEGKIIKSIPMVLVLSNYYDEHSALNLREGHVISFEGNTDILKKLPSVITQKELDSFLKPSYSCTFNVEHLFPKT